MLSSAVRLDGPANVRGPCRAVLVRVSAVAICESADVRMYGCARKRGSAFVVRRNADFADVPFCGFAEMREVGFVVQRVSADVLPRFCGFVCLRRGRTALSCCASSRPWRLDPFGLPSLTPSHLRCCALCLRCGHGRWVGAGLLFPSSLHIVLAVKVCACRARLRPVGRPRTLTAALRRAASGLGQFRPDSFPRRKTVTKLITDEQRMLLLANGRQSL